MIRNKLEANIFISNIWEACAIWEISKMQKRNPCFQFDFALFEQVLILTYISKEQLSHCFDVVVILHRSILVSLGLFYPINFLFFNFFSF